ncbi:GNAT family N-acetyltransferase [Spongorhabdus nitratireducens]
MLELARQVQQERYVDARAVFLAGSTVRGKATSFSDLDLIVVYESLPHAYRESYIWHSRPVEAFIHDSETLDYFFSRVDRPNGIPSLMNMVVEGIELTPADEFSQKLKSEARRYLEMGPPVLGPEERDLARYFLTDLLDDIRAPRNYQELIASGGKLYEKLADFYLRASNHWSASGKAIPRRLQQVDPEFSQKFDRSFETLFRDGDPSQVILLVEAVLAPYGGVLFDGFQRPAPANWKSNGFSANKAQESVCDIRLATDIDFHQLKPLMYELDRFHYQQEPERYRSPEEMDCQRTEKNIWSLYQSGQIEVIVAINNEKMVGMVSGTIKQQASVTSKSCRRGFINELVVLPEYRGSDCFGRTLAARLMQKMESHLQQQQVEEIALSVAGFNKQAIRFYKKLGYTATSHMMAKKVQPDPKQKPA